MILPKGRKNQFQANVDKIVAAELAMQQVNQQAKINTTISQNKDSLSTKILKQQKNIIDRLSLMINNGEDSMAMALRVIGVADIEEAKNTLKEMVLNSNTEPNLEYDFNIVKSSNDIYILIISVQLINKKIR